MKCILHIYNPCPLYPHVQRSWISCAFASRLCFRVCLVLILLPFVVCLPCFLPTCADSPISHVCRYSHLYTLCVPVFLIPSWFTFGLCVVFVSANEGSFYSFIQSASISCLWVLSPSPPTLTVCSFVY